jgi:hypothetical protein
LEDNRPAGRDESGGGEALARQSCGRFACYAQRRDEIGQHDLRVVDQRPEPQVADLGIDEVVVDPKPRSRP